MRHSSITGADIYYPNQIAFCFSPMMISVIQSGSVMTGAKVKIKKSTGVYWEESREPINGSVEFDVSKYVQMLFNLDNVSALSNMMKVYESALIKDVEIIIEVSTATATNNLNINIETIWGALSEDETLGGHKNITWFTKFPFTLNVMCKDGSYFDVLADGEDKQQVFNITSEDVTPLAHDLHEYIVDVRKLFAAPKRELYIASPFCIKVQDDVLSTAVQSYRMKIDNSDEGLYLRWIDRQGRYCYWLFKQNGKNTKVEEELRYNKIGDQSFSGSGLCNSLTYQSKKTSVDILTAFVPMVYKDEKEYLHQVLTSPIVDLYRGTKQVNGSDIDKWTRVNIVTGTFGTEKKNYQDFTIQIELSQKQAQGL